MLQLLLVPLVAGHAHDAACSHGTVFGHDVVRGHDVVGAQRQRAHRAFETSVAASGMIDCVVAVVVDSKGVEDTVGGIAVRIDPDGKCHSIHNHSGCIDSCSLPDMHVRKGTTDSY